MRGDRDRLDAVEHGPDRTHVLLQRAQDRWRVPQDVDVLQGGDREERRDRGGDDERGAIDALVIHDDTRARAETARRVEAIDDRSDEHVYLSGLCDMRLN